MLIPIVAAEVPVIDAFQSIGISAAPKFQPPIAKPAIVSARGPFAAASPEPAHRVSKVRVYARMYVCALLST